MCYHAEFVRFYVERSELLWRFTRKFLALSFRLSRSLKVIKADAGRSATYDFLLTLSSNHEPISYCFRDKRRFQSKIATFPTNRRVFNAPAEGFDFELGNGAWTETQHAGIPVESV